MTGPRHTPQSWETVAHLLASRLVHHALCDRHQPQRRDPACPFCADVVAYQQYRAKCAAAGRVPAALTEAGGPMVPIHDVLKQGRESPRLGP